MKANDFLDDKKPSASSFLDSNQPTGFKTKSLAELLSENAQPNTLEPGAKVVSGLPGVLEVGARRGYAGIGKIEQGALSILGDLLGSQTLSDASQVVGNRARQIENSAVLRGQRQTGFAPDSIANDIPEAGANAVSSVIQTTPSLLAGAIAPGAALPALFANTYSQEYAQGKDAGLSGGKAALRAAPMAAFEVAGEKLGGFDRLAEGLRRATRGNGVADLGTAMVSSALKEIPSEEFTTTGQFLTDKLPGIGLNQDATLADYAQQVKDTALTTALQSGAMGAGGRIIQGRQLSAPSVMENIQPETAPQTQAAPQINTPAIVDAIGQAVSNVKPSAAEFLDAEEAPNVSNVTQQPIAGVDSVAPGPELNNGTGSPAVESSRSNSNAGGDSPVPNGAMPNGDIPDGVTPGESVASVDGKTNSLSRDSSWVIRNKDTGETIMETAQKSVADKVNTDKYEVVPIQQHLAEMNDPESKVRQYSSREQLSNPLQLPVVNDSLTTEQPSNPRQLPKKSKPKANTLLSAIDGLGGIDNKYKWDISGEQKFARGGYNKIFLNASTKTLEQHIENGDLDEFLPYDMRSSVTDDPTAGRDYLADRIRNGDRVLPYDVELEAKQSKVYESDPLQADIESAITDDTLDLDTANALLSEAGYEEREQQNESRYVETEPANASGAGQAENTQPRSAAVGIASDQGRQAGENATAEPAAQNEVTGTPRSNEREGARQQVEAIVRRRAAANQLGKGKAFDNALKLAKDFMNGEEVSPAKFKNAATLFANDKPLADAFTALQELAKSPAKESRQTRRSAVDIFTEQINNAQTVDELRNIARNIQMETGVLNDAMAQQLDDMVMERIDAIENSGDLLGDNPEKQQAVADAERAKDEKRNAGTDNASDFVLTGSDRPADQAAARGAQDLFDDKEKPAFQRTSDLRSWIPNVRGGWTKEKIRKALKSFNSNTASGRVIQREIAKFKSYEDFGENIFYHGTSSYISNNLKPSITMSEREAASNGGGGYGERYWAVSVSRSKNIASNFTGMARSGSVYPVILKKGANVIDMPELSDANELDDVIEKLWTDGVDAVRIGNWDSDNSEQELAVLNPNAIFKYNKSTNFQVFNKPKFKNLNKDEIKKIYDDAIATVPKLDEIRKSGLSRDEKDKALNEVLGNGINFKRDPMLDAIANIKRQQNQVVDQVQAYVDSIAEGWKNAPNIQVVYDMNDERIPEAVRRENDRQLSQGATGQPQGFIIRGNVYIVASEMSGEKDVLRTLFHESLGHYGLRGLYNARGLNAALDRLTTMRAADVAKKAKQYGLNINNPRDRLIAAEEVLAEMAETKPEISVVKQVIAAIRAWLRENIPYFKNLELSDAEIIRDYILPARRYVETGGKEQSASDVVAAFQRGELPDTINVDGISRQTLNSNGKPIHPTREGIENFWRWFGDSKVVDEQGRPLVVYHGSPDARFLADDAVFKSIKERYGMGSSDAAHWFATDLSAAKSYADPNRAFDYQNAEPDVIPAYLKIENPLILNANGREWRSAQKRGQTSDVIDDARNANNDGVIISNVKDNYNNDWKTKATTTLTVFSSSQIKSATGNNGNFDGKNDSILFSRNQEDQPKRSMLRDELGRFKSPTGIIYDKTADIVQTLAQKVAFGQAPKELRTMTRLYKADIQKAMEAASNVVKTMAPMSQLDRSLVSDVVEKMVQAGVTPLEHIVNIATGMQNAMDIQTDELVKLGMLSQDSADRWRGKYLPRFYMRENTEGVKAWVGKMLRNSLPVRGIGGNSLKGRGLFEEVNVNEVPKYESLGWEVRDPLWKKNRQGELELVDANKVVSPEKVVVWRDWTPSERAEMGENRDALFRFVMGYTSMQNDIALGRLFDSIAKNQEWTRARASDGYVKVPDSEIPDTGGVKRYGNLAGLYVKKEILDHISQYEEASELWKYYRKALSFWKAGKTVLNPVAHVNNVVSNLTMAHFAGVSYWDAHKYVLAIKDLANNAPMVQEAKDRGLMTGDITRADLMADMPDDIKEMMQMQESAIKRKASTVFNIVTFGLSKPMSKAYRFEDDFFKYLIYRDARKNGLSPDDAVDYATKYIFTYDDLPKGARTVRDLAIPFFAYTYKAVPALTHTLFNYPWRFAAPAAAVWGVNAIAYALAAGDDGDDWQTMYEKGKELEAEERDNLPPWMQGRSALGAQKSIRLGTDEKTQLPVYMDVSRMIPGGDIFDVTNQADGVPVPAPIMPSNPVLTTIAAMFWNKDTFTGKEVTDLNDTGKEAAQKRAEWLLKQLSPAVAPTAYHFDRLAEATALMSDKTVETPWKDYTGYGKDGLPVQGKYALPQTFGIKARPIDLERSAEISKGQDNKEIRSIMAEIRQASRLLDQNAISQREYDRRVSDAEEKISAIESK